MNVSAPSKLEMLRANYGQATGLPFDHFFCPVLWKDEDVTLCEAHIVNQAFPNSAPDWTVQRKDVDNFYGWVFEDDFLAFRYYEDRSIAKALVDKNLSKRLRPKILLNAKPVGYFIAHGDLPKHLLDLILSMKDK